MDRLSHCCTCRTKWRKEKCIFILFVLIVLILPEQALHSGCEHFQNTSQINTTGPEASLHLSLTRLINGGSEKFRALRRDEKSS
ncbi:uncharacterized [Tachysurus ichikawai]